MSRHHKILQGKITKDDTTDGVKWNNEIDYFLAGPTNKQKKEVPNKQINASRIEVFFQTFSASWHIFIAGK